MHFDNLSADVSGFRVPGNMVADFEFAYHAVRSFDRWAQCSH
jgi:hypothetical protein